MALLLLISALLVCLVSAVASPQLQKNTAAQNVTDDTPAATSLVTPVFPSPSPYGGSARNSYKGPLFAPLWAQNTVPRLPQWVTNGGSVLGTHRAPHLPPWLDKRPSWDGSSASNRNPYTSPPFTGKTRQYNFTIAQQMIAPDGVQKPGLVVNGAFPGPTIEANWGDWIEVTVYNNLPSEGTSFHWHGLLQTATPWMDGVPAVQQCPIPPGGSFTYRFQADMYGTSWWHSHYSAQYAAGLFGPMIIYGPDTGDYDVDLGPVLISDWYHGDYHELVKQVMAPASEHLLPPSSNNNLINGKMNYPCANTTRLNCTANAGISKFFVISGKSYRLRLINAGSEGTQKFSIDGYSLTVIANDFVPIQPYTTDVVTLAVGQRTDVVLEATGEPTDAVYMRSTLGKSAFNGGCNLIDGISPVAVAAMYYENANDTVLPNTTSSIPDSEINNCANDPLSKTVPAYPITPEPNPETVQIINVTFQSNGTHNLFYMNNQTFRADYNNAVLLGAQAGQVEFPSEWNVFNFHMSKTIRFIVYNYARTGAHPMHMHGHNMYVLQFGTGTWDGSITNAHNPQRRDVQILPNAVSPVEPGYVVLQIDADNPGVWPFHCHIAWHVSAGLYINILERPGDLRNVKIPSEMGQTCADWSAWTEDNVPDEIDSGL